MAHLSPFQGAGISLPACRRRKNEEPCRGPRPFRCEATQRVDRCEAKTHGRGRIVMHRTHGCCAAKPAHNQSLAMGAAAPAGPALWHPCHPERLCWRRKPSNCAGLPRVPWPTSDFLEFWASLRYQGIAS